MAFEAILYMLSKRHYHFIISVYNAVEGRGSCNDGLLAILLGALCLYDVLLGDSHIILTLIAQHCANSQRT